ncbi:DegV family protein [Marinilactibacillus psychrotolerans]|uniref:DegV family protein n=1 Tax=Marinilactibacillus psychrotolerans TaxID=191770 RepID=UPI001C7D8383|nr:DegV family protein [Marinilactibacillus psychrotolerans]GEQ32951.1 DegV family protein [Marinilactibacillus psychrotolerans]
MEYQIITDSCCDLPLDIMKEYNIEVFNFVISIENEELIDDMGLTFNKDQFFKRLKDGAIASTSQVNVHTYIEKFKQYIEKDKPVIYLAFSSELSGSYNNAVQAINILKEEYGTVEISIVDTRAASLGQGLLVYEAAKRKREGMSLSDVVEWIEEVKNSVHSWVTVDDIKHLQRGGRISATAATVGSILSIKPIIVMTSEGKLVPFSKVRGRKKSLHFLVDKTLEGIIEPESQTIFIGHVGVLEDAEYVKELLESRQKFKQVVITSYGPTVASHTGFGSLAVFSFGKEK